MFGITLGDIFLVVATALAVSAIELTIGAVWIPRFVFAWVRANLSDLIEDINDDPDAQRIIGELMEKMQEHVKKLIGGYIGKMKQSARPQDMLMQLLMHAGVGWAQQQGFIPPQVPPPPQP